MASTSGSGSSVQSPSNNNSSQINVFRIPHSRMKELVEQHIRKVSKIENFSSSDVDVDVILQALYQAMWELKSHEYIENHYIMDTLKARLQARRIYNQLVCNCHEDSKLLGVIGLVEKVYSANDENEKEAFGRELRDAIQDFLGDFLHHMEEEEQVFQPLLMENFETKELAAMNEVVLKQHSLFRQKVQSEKTLKAIKRKREEVDGLDEFEFSIEALRFRKSYCQEVAEHCQDNSQHAEPASKKSKLREEDKETSQASQQDPTIPTLDGKSLGDLPNELILEIMAFLSPLDLLRCSMVCKRWNKLSFQGRLWRTVNLNHWFQHLDLPSQKDDDLTESDKRLGASVVTTLVTSVLPKVGSSVIHLRISNTHLVLNSTVSQILHLCPKLEVLDLSYTDLDERAFTDTQLRKLSIVNLEGCLLVNDEALLQLVSSTNKLRCLNISGCKEISSFAISMLEQHKDTLEEMDISGCYMVDGQTLTELAEICDKIQPERLSYCSDIEDGPFPAEANGCSNLECSIRFCCRQLKN